MYWESGYRVPLVAETFVPNRREETKGKLDFINNLNDKLHKIRSFLNSIVTNFCRVCKIRSKK